MTEAIRCPKCGSEIPLGDAIEHQVAEELNERLAGEQNRWKAERAKALAAREAELRAEFVAAQVLRDKEVTAQAEAKVSDELHDLQEQLAAQAETIKAARAQELEFRKAQRKLDDERAGIELEIARRLDDERTQLVDRATERLDEEYRLKLRERDETLAQMKAQIDDLKRAAEPTRAGLQGEVLERQVEDVLREHFPEDEISPVKAGTRGADIVQKVRHPHDRECGTILWESKRAARWSNGWITKLREDQKAAKADVAVIVSTVLPPGVSYMDLHDGIWVVNSVCVVGAAEALRAGLIAVEHARAIDASRSDALALLHDYLCGKEFRGRFEPIVRTIIEMKTDLDSERRGVEKFWAKREKEIDRMARAAIGMYGDLQGILGAALPTVGELELPAG